ncbi:MAG: glycosyltransferase family 4 protein [Candidatus Pacebacteria bacterium]|nr:glycosyltransferase family 4 protein [Candidatus Paceibacterota bacterium]
MKIILLHDSFPPYSFGGGGISVQGIAAVLKKIGHDVSVITTCRKESEEGVFDCEGIRVFRIASDYSERWRAYRSLYNNKVVHKVEEIFKKIGPDVVHINSIHHHLSYHCLKLARQQSEVVIFTARDVMLFNFGKLQTSKYLRNFDYRTTWHDHIKQARKRWNPFRNFIIKRYLRYADKVFAISKSLRDALNQNDIEHVEVIYNGIDVSEWLVDQRIVVDFQTKYSLQGRRVILFGGRLSAAKGAEKTLEALVKIVKEIPNATLLVMGKIDWYAQVMKGYARDLDIEEHLVFTGWIKGDEIRAAYAASNVVLMPSICFDSFGRINIEAMASKKPVIGTCYGGTPEIVDDGVTGYIVNPMYPEEIAEKTLDLLKNPERADRFGKAGYERVKSHFNLEDKVKEYIAVYEALLEEKKSGPM